MEENIRKRAPSGERIMLAQNVPLEKPLAIRISPTNCCNFSCEYCAFALPEYRKTYSGKFMEFSLYEKILQSIHMSFGKVSRMFLVGAGEPLLHPRIADMVALAVEMGVTDTIEIVTNGVLLTKKLSDALIQAGLSLIRISVNGLSDEDFKKYCGTTVKFEEYVNQIRYLYEHRKNLTIYTKIMNYMVTQEERYHKFINTFGPYADTVNVENLVQADARIDYDAIVQGNVVFDKTVVNTKLLPTAICSMAYYTLQIDENGKVYPCCSVSADRQNEVPCLGDATKEELGDIWRGKGYHFQRKMLEGAQYVSQYCKECKIMSTRVQPEDILDLEVDFLREKYDHILESF